MSLERGQHLDQAEAAGGPSPGTVGWEVAALPHPDLRLRPPDSERISFRCSGHSVCSDEQRPPQRTKAAGCQYDARCLGRDGGQTATRGSREPVRKPVWSPALAQGDGRRWGCSEGAVLSPRLTTGPTTGLTTGRTREERPGPPRRPSEHLHLLPAGRWPPTRGPPPPPDQVTPDGFQAVV